ncbi:hypothetical protein LC612_38360 [Nostoc sp. CHAB 5834]|nr:hypothetical protein [Nostoc sp. CHAB 5834]
MESWFSCQNWGRLHTDAVVLRCGVPLIARTHGEVVGGFRLYVSGVPRQVTRAHDRCWGFRSGGRPDG